ncbi:MAG: DUF2541 family protein [Alphaproteobacteria bacterium]
MIRFKNLFLAGLALAATVLAPAASYAARWEMLGEKTVGFRVDHDVIRVGHREGRYERLKMRVLRNDIMLLNAKVVYGNGSVDRLRIHKMIREGTETRPFELPGFRGRYIRRIELTYRSRPSFDGRAIVQIFGDPVHRRHDRDRWRDRRDDARGDRYEEDRPRRRHYEWISLGHRKVGLSHDRDVIHVGRREGNFRKIKLKVSGNSIRLYDVKVVYGNGSVDHIPVRKRIRQNRETGPLDLRGRDRIIRRIELTYERNLNFRGSAYVEVFGLQAD